MLDLDTLLRGFDIFREEFAQETSKEKLEEFTQNQNPETLIISCSDSRVDPAILLHFRLGEVFSIRNIANIIPPYQSDHTTYHGTSSALEYAVKILEVKTIIVLGHSDCGGIRALLEHEESEKKYFDYILEWVFILKDAKTQISSKNSNIPPLELVHLCEKKGIEISLKNLETFPFIQERMANGTLKMMGLYFSLSDLHLEYYNPSSKLFQIC